MEKKTKIEIGENKIPRWIFLIWGVFAIWGLLYLAYYWLPDILLWLKGGDPDEILWFYTK